MQALIAMGMLCLLVFAVRVLRGRAPDPVLDPNWQRLRERRKRDR